ncbi:TFIIB-type zinc ribbon-containing protein [Halolamina sp.]|jgi:hypothetical protein|uniref:TFIIB-type zinc ribbon-containing protein n=1 Tax=Halolamina sp. TaxID=1940283 RepID=UPI000223B568|nr:hypothetical protein Halar_1718 [halophilic archaeon DL31]
MKLRGQRECKNCGTRWSYYETGEATCPDCGSLRSVGVEDERKQHTDSPAELDLTAARSAVGDDAKLVEVADEIQDACRQYLRKRGFINGGELRTLDDTFLAAQELRAAIADYGRDWRVGVDRGSFANEATEGYLLGLLAGAAEGERPASEAVPDSMTAARGLAYARAVKAYREDVSTYLDDNHDTEARRVLDRIRDHEKRQSALDGDVSAETAETLVRACRALHRRLTAEGEAAERALAEAREELERLDAA